MLPAPKALHPNTHGAAVHSPRLGRWPLTAGLLCLLFIPHPIGAAGVPPDPPPGPPPRSAAAASTCSHPSLAVRKREGIVELSCQGRAPQRFLATFGQNPTGPKLREGDERTPEGSYFISSRVETPRFHRFLGVSYPNAADLRRAQQLGISRPGGGIGIHGVQASKNTLARIWLRLGHTLRLNRLWGPTDGCIGVSNEDIEVLYAAVRVGTPVEITP